MVELRIVVEEGVVSDARELLVGLELELELLIIEDEEEVEEESEDSDEDSDEDEENIIELDDEKLDIMLEVELDIELIRLEESELDSELLLDIMELEVVENTELEVLVEFGAVQVPNIGSQFPGPQ